MDPQKIARYGQRLHSTFPIFGKMRRRSACRKLAAASSPEAVPHLAEALQSPDPEVCATATTALSSLQDPAAIDALCFLWAEKRDHVLGGMVAECGYVAREPLKLRVLTALKARRLEAAQENPDGIGFLAQALLDPDALVKENGGIALRSLTNQHAIDALCDLAIADPTGPAMVIVKEIDYQPQSVSRRCLLFLLAGQTERYLDLDFEFQHLRAEYQAADEGLKQRIGEVVRASGDARLVGLFREVRRRKLARDLSVREADIVVGVHARNRQWAEIFSLLFQIPLRSVISALSGLAASGWRPEGRVEAALLAELIAARQGTGQLPPAPPPPEVALGPVMQAWIEQGRSPAWTGKSEDELRFKFTKRGTFIQGPPTDAVRALAALAVPGKTTAADVESARTHPHWPVRLACLALCEVAPQFAFSDQPTGGEGGGRWIDRLAPSGGRWIDRLAPSLLDAATYQRRAVSLNPDQLEALQSVVNQPGEPGDSRRVCGRLLEALARHDLRHTILVDKEMTVEISETAIEIEG